MKVKTSKLLSLALVGLLLSACQTPTGLTPRQQALLQAQGFQPTDEGWELGLSDRVLFANEVASLTPASRTTVEQIGLALLSVDIDWARLDGHTDSYGAREYNQRLSLLRAESVAEVLVDTGMPRQNLEVRGLADTKPVASNRTREGRAQNRRVAIVITD